METVPRAPLSLSVFLKDHVTLLCMCTVVYERFFFCCFAILLLTLICLRLEIVSQDIISVLNSKLYEGLVFFVLGMLYDFCFRPELVKVS